MTSTAVHARTERDRRCRPTPLFSRYSFVGRRRAGRRHGEVDRIYVDVHSAPDYALTVTLVLLSIADLALTQLHVEQGGAELNPLMARAIDRGFASFVLAKLTLTVGGALVLLAHARFPLARTSLRLLVCGYVGLMLWHGYVIFARGA